MLLPLCLKIKSWCLKLHYPLKLLISITIFQKYFSWVWEISHWSQLSKYSLLSRPSSAFRKWILFIRSKSKFILELKQEILRATGDQELSYSEQSTTDFLCCFTRSTDKNSKKIWTLDKINFKLEVFFKEYSKEK